MESKNSIPIFCMALFFNIPIFAYCSDTELNSDKSFEFKFKTLEAKNGESVIGVSYEIEKNIKNIIVDTAGGKWNKSYSMGFNASGTVTQNKLENPRNFLNTTVEFNTIYYSKIERHSDEYADELDDLIKVLARCSEEKSNSSECQSARKKQKLIMQEISAYNIFEFGFDAGYETDQSFSVKQEKISLVAFSHFDYFKEDSFLGATQIKPALLLSLDSIDPNEETPRAKAGDNSSYYRFSGEVSLSMPIDTESKVPLTLAYNYRYYDEISASQVVKDANLDSYHLRTWSLAAANGLFLSYSEGRLPFDLNDDNVVELGWATNF